jgi:tRNA threonylcarbamoyladenosine biosynthesis protein TsaB
MARGLGSIVILAIDTSTSVTTVAVGDGDEVLSAAEHDDARGHAEVIGGLVRDALLSAGVERTERVVCGVGPGPYTGLRVGISFARGLALAWGVPVQGVCSLDALGFEVHALNKAGATYAVAQDARRREVFWARYDAAGDRLAGPFVQRPADIAAEDRALPWFGPAADLVRPDAPTAQWPSAAWLARLVHHRGDAVLVPALPIYLRDPDATLPASAGQGAS